MTTRISFTLLIRPRQNQTSHWNQYVGRIFNHCAGQLTQHSSCSDSRIHSHFPELHLWTWNTTPTTFHEELHNLLSHVKASRDEEYFENRQQQHLVGTIHDDDINPIPIPEFVSPGFDAHETFVGIPLSEFDDMQAMFNNSMLLSDMFHRVCSPTVLDQAYPYFRVFSVLDEHLKEFANLYATLKAPALYKKKPLKSLKFCMSQCIHHSTVNDYDWYMYLAYSGFLPANHDIQYHRFDHFYFEIPIFPHYASNDYLKLFDWLKACAMMRKAQGVHAPPHKLKQPWTDGFVLYWNSAERKMFENFPQYRSSMFYKLDVPWEPDLFQTIQRMQPRYKFATENPDQGFFQYIPYCYMNDYIQILTHFLKHYSDEHAADNDDDDDDDGDQNHLTADNIDEYNIVPYQNDSLLADLE